jgi:hypothetical protein
MAESVEIVISAKDRVSGTLTKIGASLAIFARKARKGFSPWHVAIHLLIEGFIRLGHVVGRVLERAARRVVDLGKKFFSLKGQVTAALASFGIGFTLKSIIDAGAYFENLRANLRFLIGDSEEVEKEVRRIIQLVKSTPFEFQDIAEARQNLLQFGYLTEEVFAGIADAAAARKKEVSAAVDAVVNATQREFSMLKDFGILTRQTGSQIELFFKDLAGVNRRVVTETDPESILRGVMTALQARFKGQLQEFQGLWVNLMNRLKKEWFLFRAYIAKEGGVLDRAKIALTLILTEIGKITDTEGYTQFTRLFAASFNSAIQLILRGLDALKVVLPIIVKQVLNLGRGMERLGGVANLAWSYLLFGGTGAKLFASLAYTIGLSTDAMGGLGSKADQTRSSVDSLLQSMTFFGGEGSGLLAGGATQAITQRTERLKELSFELKKIEETQQLTRAEFMEIRFPEIFAEGVEEATEKLGLLQRTMFRIRKMSAYGQAVKELDEMDQKAQEVRATISLLEQDMKRLFGPSTKLLIDSFERDWSKALDNVYRNMRSWTGWRGAIWSYMQESQVRTATLAVEAALPSSDAYTKVLQAQADFKLAAVAKERELRAALQEEKITSKDLIAQESEIAADLGTAFMLIEQLTTTRLRNITERLVQRGKGTTIPMTVQLAMEEDEQKIIRSLEAMGIRIGKKAGRATGDAYAEAFQNSKVAQLRAEIAAIGTEGVAKAFADLRVQLEGELEQVKEYPELVTLVWQKFHRQIHQVSVDAAKERTERVQQIEITALESRGAYDEAIRKRATMQMERTLEIVNQYEEDLRSLRTEGEMVTAEQFREVEAMRVHAVKIANKQIETETIQHNQRRRQLTDELRVQRARIADLSRPTEPDWGPLNLFFGISESDLAETEQKLQEFRRRSEELVLMFSGAELAQQQKRLSELFKLDELERAIEERKRQVEEFAQYFADKFADAFSQIATGQKSLKEGFADMARSMLAELQKLIVRAIFYKAILWAISKISARFPRIGGVLGGVLTAGAPGGPAAATAATSMSKAAQIQVRTSGVMARSANIITNAVNKQTKSVEEFGRSVTEFAQAVKNMSGDTPVAGTTGGGPLAQPVSTRQPTLGGMGGFGGACHCQCICVLSPDSLESIRDAAERLQGVTEVMHDHGDTLGKASWSLLTASDVLLEHGGTLKGATMDTLLASRFFRAAAADFATAVIGFSVAVSNFQKAQGMSAIAGALGSIGSMSVGAQHGGIVTKPLIALIGEGQEPEAIVPLSRADDYGFGGGGKVSISQTVIFNSDGSMQETSSGAGDDVRVSRIQAVLKDEWVRIAIEQMRPGGILDGREGR